MYPGTITDRIGIGTTNPTAGLDVVMVTADAARLRSGDANTGLTAGHSPRILIQNTNGTTNNTEDVTFADSSSVNAQIVCINQNHTTHQSALSLQTTTSGSVMTEAVRVASTGYVGIGTTNPGTTLDAYGDQPVVRVRDDGSAGLGVYLQQANTNQGYLINEANAPLGLGANNIVHMTIGSGGLVGIGTTNPASPIHLYTASAASMYARFQDPSGTVDVGIETAGYGYLSVQSNIPLVFGTNTTERMRISAAGLVGIGTNSPGNTLDVRGALCVIRAESTTGTNSCFASYVNSGGSFYVGHEASVGSQILTGTSAYSGVISVASGYNMHFGTNGAIRMTIDSAGLVGIGTMPSTPLHVCAPGGVILVESSTGTNSTYIQFNNTAGQMYVGRERSTGGDFLNGAAYAGIIGVQDAHSMQLATSGSVQMTIDSAGLVGIGTTSPGAALDIRNTTGIVRVESTTATNACYAVFINDTGNDLFIGQESSIGASILPGSTAYSSVIFNDKPRSLHLGTSNAVCMTIDSTGKVGIGTASPVYKFHVHENVNGDCAILVYNPNAGTLAASSLRLGNDASFGTGGISVFGSGFPSSGMIHGNGTYIWNTQSGGVTLNSLAAQPIYFGTNNTERMRIDSAGNVGIGTSPSFKMHVYEASGAPYSIVDAAGVRTGMMSNSLSSTGWMGTYSAHTCYIGAAGSTSQMVLLTTGAVGIGTSPTATLDVVSSGSAPLSVTGPSTTMRMFDFTLGNDATYNIFAGLGLSTAALVGYIEIIVLNWTGVSTARWNFNGTASTLQMGVSTYFSSAIGTAAHVNVGVSGGYYYIENKSGLSRNFTAVYFGLK
jgi:hypothetical protein